MGERDRLGAGGISVVLPTRNGARHLDEAIASVVGQSHSDWELVVVDDGSTDDTPEIIARWMRRDPRIRCLRVEESRGLPAALNLGFEQTSRACLTWTSDDNGYAPTAFERLLGVLEADPSCDVVYAGAERIDDDGRFLGLWRTGEISELPLRNVVGACFLYRRHVHEELGGYDEDLSLAEDYDFWLRASTHFGFRRIDEHPYRYREHPRSLTALRQAEVERAARRAQTRHLPALAADRQARVRLHWASSDFVAGETAAGRRHWIAALRTHPQAVLERGFRSLWLDMVLGGRIGRAARRLRSTAGDRGDVVVLVPDVLGGVASFASSLAHSLPPGRVPLRVLRLRDLESAEPPALGLAFGRGSQRVMHSLAVENLFGVLRRLRRAIGRGPGVLVTCDLLGLSYAAWRGERAVVQILHGDVEVYYALAAHFAAHVDRFAVVSQRIGRELARRLPDRATDIRLLPLGVTLPEVRRRPGEGALRVVYVGRMDRRKGVLSLPRIDRALRKRGVVVRWTLVGAGPEESELRGAFAAADVVWPGALARQAIPPLLAEQDVFVLPSHAEGLPLALLEAMATGLVPVVSDLESGVREVVEPGRCGALVPAGDIAGFAEAIAAYAGDRTRLEAEGAEALERVRRDWRLEERAGAYAALFEELRASPPRRALPLRRGPRRLDRPWLPNPLVRLVRGLARLIRSRRG